jgi:hypothetical protein
MPTTEELACSISSATRTTCVAGVSHDTECEIDFHHPPAVLQQLASSYLELPARVALLVTRQDQRGAIMVPDFRNLEC